MNPFDYMPLTFHIMNGANDQEFNCFKEVYFRLKNDSEMLNNGGSIWIIKPGENSNRGTNIQICSKLTEIQQIISNKEYHSNGKKFTYIMIYPVQKYIEKPMLFNKRKFDIRCYILLSSVKGNLRGYWYKDGYIRTSSKEYTTKNLENKLVHLTNDAIQKKSDHYGKYEYGNKISIDDFHRYIEKNYPDKNFMNVIFNQMKSIATDAIKSVYFKIDPFKRVNTFELFGLDYMLDEECRPWLIEINANPCLEISCSVLNRIIPALIENIWKIAIDPLFPPPETWPKMKRCLIPENPYINNKFELVFDEQVSHRHLKDLLEIELMKIDDYSEDDVCDDD